jgi:transposase-like protein
VGIFPNRAAAIRLVGMMLCEQHDEWQVVRRYMSPASLAKARLEVIEGEAVEEVKGELVAAS